MVEVSRDGQRIYVTNSLYAPGTRSSTRRASAAGWPSSTRRRPVGLTVDQRFFVPVRGRAAAPDSPGGRRLVVRLVLLPVIDRGYLAVAGARRCSGAYHGLNPAMGWLFAVALGLQETSRRRCPAPWRPSRSATKLSVRWRCCWCAAPRRWSRRHRALAGAVALIGFGVFKFLRPRCHPRWVGMRVTCSIWSLWSFLMSSAHGAGLMLFPILIGLPAPIDAETAGAVGTSVSLNVPGLIVDGAAVCLHTFCMLVVMAIISYVVYEKIGLAISGGRGSTSTRSRFGAVFTTGFVTLFTGF